MKSALASLIVLFSLGFSSAQASQSFHFFYTGQHMGQLSMVSCDTAEYELRELLDLFGARGISTLCTGGVNPWGSVTPLNLSATFDLEPVRGADYRVETFDMSESTLWSPSCYFSTDLVKSLVRDLPNVRITRSFDACFSNTDHFDYRFEVKFPN